MDIFCLLKNVASNHFQLSRLIGYKDGTYQEGTVQKVPVTLLKSWTLGESVTATTRRNEATVLPKSARYSQTDNDDCLKMEGFLLIMIAVARLGHARSLEAFIYLEYGRRERMNTIKKQGLTQFHTADTSGRSVERPDCRQLRSCQWQSLDNKNNVTLFGLI